jgi:hypothetical protein
MCSYACVCVCAGYSRVMSNVIQAPVLAIRGFQNLQPQQRRFNVRMAKLRISAEWMFKDITSVWTYLKGWFGLKVKQQPVGMYYIVAADLTNLRTILRGGGQTSKYFGCPPPELEEYIAPRMYLDHADMRLHVPLMPDVGEAVDEALADEALDGHHVVGVPADTTGLVDEEERLMVAAEDDDDDNALVDLFGRLVLPAPLGPITAV